MLTVADVVAILHRLAPPELAEDWDNVGLLLGDPAATVARVMTCLTVTPESAEEAVASGVELVVSHHPVLFRPTQRLTAETPDGRTLLALLRGGVALYSPHTAFDNAPGGINDGLCRRLGLTDVRPLRPGPADGRFKVVVFVPEGDLARVSDAVFAAGAGVIGQYRECSFRLHGTGTFFGTDAANPTVGQKGRREEVAEWRLEVVCPAGRLREVLHAMRAGHSYEEPAFDVYPLWSPPGGPGVGRLGFLSQPEPLEAFARRVRQAVGAAAVEYVGEPQDPVRQVAVVCGAGGSLLGDAARAGADVLLTGELRFHDQLAARAQGLAVVLTGHYASERQGVEDLAARLAVEFPALVVWPSRREADPAHHVG
jgi:dinuclear metal center YbgI/SA1388 family protein